MNKALKKYGKSKFKDVISKKHSQYHKGKGVILKIGSSKIAGLKVASITTQARKG